MTVVMRDAIEPNLVQTLEHQPVLLHAGPFGNIAHANNSIVEDRVALKLADYVVTEAGFASDLGFQKFCDIVCRFGGFAPERRRARHHRPRDEVARRDARSTTSGTEDLDALRRGIDNLTAHVQILREYGLPCVVSINNFPTDTDAEIELIGELAVRGGRRDRRREPRVRRGRRGRGGARGGGRRRGRAAELRSTS